MSQVYSDGGERLTHSQTRLILRPRGNVLNRIYGSQKLPRIFESSVQFKGRPRHLVKWTAIHFSVRTEERT